MTRCVKGCQLPNLRVNWVSVTRRCFRFDTRLKRLPTHCNRSFPLWPTRPKRTKCSKMRGKKSDPHLNPSDPPRRRANKRKGRGTYANDRPPIIGTVGRQSGQVRLRVAHHTDKQTLSAHVHQFTDVCAPVYTDEWQGYLGLNRHHDTVCHGKRQWVTDADGDGIREVHTNTIEGVWTTVRNFIRPFRGIHKKFLAGYIALCEFRINSKLITTDFISKLVDCTKS